MGARQSKRSVDISATPPKKGAEENGAVASEDASVKLEKVPENVENVKATLNGDATRTEATPTLNGETPAQTESETPAKAVEATPETATTPEKVESPDVTSPVTSPDEKTSEEGEKTSEKPEKTKEKKRSKIMKSLRSLSFSKKAKPEKILTSPTPEDKSEKTEENGTEAAKPEEASSPLTAVLEETATAAATKVEETLTEVKKEVVTVCEKVTKEITEKVEAVVEKVEAVVEKKSEPEQKAEKTESVSAPAEEVPPPLPASPPPSELPSPTPVVAPTETIKNVVNDHQQQDAEDMNGGGESLAEFTPETEEPQVLVNGDHAVTNGTNGIDEEIKPPTSDKVEEDLSSKMESLKMQNSEDLPEIIVKKTTELTVAYE